MLGCEVPIVKIFISKFGQSKDFGALAAVIVLRHILGLRKESVSTVRLITCRDSGPTDNTSELRKMKK